MFLKPDKREVFITGGGGGSEICLNYNGNLTVYCASDKHQKTNSIGESNTITS